MAGDGGRRAELGTFLRTRRIQVDRAEHGLPPAGRARTGGLRREEMALLSGVSSTWYTWLEQGRDINPSRQVIDAVATTLRLSVAEHDYVLRLAGFAPAAIDPGAGPESLAAHHQRLLDAQGSAPAFVLASDWRVIGWNSAYEVLYPRVAATDAAERNLLVMVFTDPYVRAMLPDWESTSRHFLAEYRAEATALLSRPEHLALVRRLRATSPEFDAAWGEHAVERFASRVREFEHPHAGRLVFEHHSLTPSDAPGTHLVIYLPEAGSATAERMRGLLDFRL